MPGIDINRFLDLSEEKTQYLKCCVCHDIYDNPINSDCGHTFCKTCIKEWIESNHKECPECRKVFTKKRSNGNTNNDNMILISNYVFIRNLKIAEMISDLKVKCDFVSNGCHESVDFGLLTAHLKKCSHKICKTCGLGSGGSADRHNCAELLMRDRNSWKLKFNEMRDKNKSLEVQLKGNAIKIVMWKKKENEWKLKHSKLTQVLNKYKTTDNLLKSKNRNHNKLISELKEKNLSLEITKNEFKSKYENSQRVLQVMKDKVLRLEEEVNKSNSDRNEWKSMYENILKQMKILNEKLENQQKKWTLNQKVIKQLEDKNSKLENEVQRKESLLKSKSNEIEDKKSKLEDIQRNSKRDENRWKQRLECRDKKVKELKTKLEDNNKSTEKDVRHWKQKYEMRGKDINALKDKISKLEEFKKMNEKESNKWKQKCEDFNTLIAHLEESHRNTNEEMTYKVKTLRNYSNQVLDKRVDNIESDDKRYEINENLEQKVSDLERELKNIEHELKVVWKQLNDSEEKYKEIEYQNNKLNHNLDLTKTFIDRLRVQTSDVTLRTDIVMIGTHEFYSCRIKLSKVGIHFFSNQSNYRNYFVIEFESMRELKYCSDPNLSVIFIRPETHSCHEILEHIDRFSGWFDVESEVISQRYISIKFHPQSVAPSDWISLICFSFENKPELNCKSIDKRKAEDLLDGALGLTRVPQN